MYDTVTGQRIRYPKIAGSLVDSINALVARGEVRLPGGSTPCSVVAADSPGGYDTCLTLSCTVGGSPVRVRLNPTAVDCLLGDLIAAPEFASLDNDLKLAVLETALTLPLDALTALLRAEVVLESIVGDPVDAGAPSRALDGDRAAPIASSLLFEVRQPPEVVRCAVQVDLVSPLPGSVVQYLAESLAGRRRDLGGLPVPVTFELGAASLSSAELRSLEPGDVVLFDQCYVREGRMRVNVGDRVFHMGELEGYHLTVQGGIDSEAPDQ